MSSEPITLDSQFFFVELAQALSGFDFLKTTYCDQDMIGRCIPTYETENGVTFLNVDMEYIAPFGNNTYTRCIRSVTVGPYTGKMKLRDLPLQPLFDLDVVDQFVQRGNLFKTLTQKPTYKQANGFMYVPTWTGMKRLPINSRVVIDPEGYKKYQDANRWHNNETLHEIPEDMWHATLPCLPVYSLEYRMWGEIPVTSLEDIVFDETAFDRTILRQDYKKLIGDLVLNFYGTECCDFIAGKKRGLVFLLNGPPGVGKTLTAHGIAELTHRPLYTIGSGDIGTSPDMIDKTLQKIFNMVGNWNGIVLIDEADVFMSKRTDYDVQYNACVSVFLRLIETYFGILFLTTNRDHGIDPAFDSRIHIRLRYHELEEDDRAKVWNESFTRYKIHGVDTNILKKVKLNNREIANIVQLAYISNGGDPTKVTHNVVESFVKLRQGFNNGVQ
ncbi:AAA+ ATPase [Fadolivirus algeromassiliense]|uniref:AAA+ ATPase n=1 Tax=Fadolivirus FV1/VV64 TaxID=3070911 RepID=A0A7D3V8R8_9VIRU|nr:AAA+ ATPase [Fadolivirus algeromassiliense]QKF93997.1 AAA+ ATPase [Fadolivirus FV1/VV64]